MEEIHCLKGMYYMEDKGIIRHINMEQKEEVVKEVDLAIIGGGPAGLAVAVEAWKHGVKDILILEREIDLGGILQQCIHTGFGLKVFGEELTGPEYAERFIKQVEYLGIEFKLDTMVIDISIDKIPTVKNIGDKFIDKSIIEEIDIDGIVSDGTTSNRITDDRIACDRINYDRINHDRTSGYKIITAVNKKDGLIRLKAKTVVLAMGCRERTRGALNIPGTRPAGIFTAGTAQRFVNMEGYLPGKKVVILGSGDIGLIMARRITLEGAEVKMVCELMSYPGGLNRNIVQCLNDFNIPLKLNYTVVEIHGKKRVEGVTIAQVDNNRKPITGTYEYVKCDTLLLSVGLIPENELSIEAGVAIDSVTSGPIVNESMETSIEGVFACGNVVHVHDLVDRVTEEAMLAGRSAARYIHSMRDKKQYKSIQEGYIGTQEKVNIGCLPNNKGNIKYISEREYSIGDIPQQENNKEYTPEHKKHICSNLPDYKYDDSIQVIRTIAGQGIRYIVPQIIRKEFIEDDSQLLFRVRDVYRDVRISMISGGEKIYSIKKVKVAPGEMESIKLTKQLMDRVKNGCDIIVQLEGI